MEAEGQRQVKVASAPSWSPSINYFPKTRKANQHIQRCKKVLTGHEGILKLQRCPQ